DLALLKGRRTRPSQIDTAASFPLGGLVGRGSSSFEEGQGCDAEMVPLEQGPKSICPHSALPIVCKRSRTPTNRERNRQMTETKGNSTILQGKRAVIFGAGGSVGSAVAREFALEGAEVFLAGRTKSRLDEVAKEISMAGGLASVAVVDALNAQAVDEYIDRVEGFGKIDIEFNAVGPPAADYGSGKPALQLSVDEFMVPLT